MLSESATRRSPHCKSARSSSGVDEGGHPEAPDALRWSRLTPLDSAGKRRGSYRASVQFLVQDVRVDSIVAEDTPDGCTNVPLLDGPRRSGTHETAGGYRASSSWTVLGPLTAILAQREQKGCSSRPSCGHLPLLSAAVALRDHVSAVDSVTAAPLRLRRLQRPHRGALYRLPVPIIVLLPGRRTDTNTIPLTWATPYFRFRRAHPRRGVAGATHSCRHGLLLCSPSLGRRCGMPAGATLPVTNPSFSERNECSTTSLCSPICAERTVTPTCPP